MSVSERTADDRPPPTWRAARDPGLGCFEMIVGFVQPCSNEFHQDWLSNDLRLSCRAQAEAAALCNISFPAAVEPLLGPASSKRLLGSGLATVAEHDQECRETV